MVEMSRLKRFLAAEFEIKDLSRDRGDKKQCWDLCLCKKIYFRPFERTWDGGL